MFPAVAELTEKLAFVVRTVESQTCFQGDSPLSLFFYLEQILSLIKKGGRVAGPLQQSRCQGYNPGFPLFLLTSTRQSVRLPLLQANNEREIFCRF